MTTVSCCEQGSHTIRKDAGCYWYGNTTPPIKFCPFCGANLHSLTLEQSLKLLAESDQELTICFDVDGVICDDSDQTIPYDERPPYHWVKYILSTLRAHGHTIHVQTARYMEKCDGDQERAIRRGEFELRNWLRFHDIPYDMAYCGKASAHIYVDDRGCRVASKRGIIDWANVFLPLVHKIQRERSERANVRIQV